MKNKSNYNVGCYIKVLIRLGYSLRLGIQLGCSRWPLHMKPHVSRSYYCQTWANLYASITLLQLQCASGKQCSCAFAKTPCSKHRRHCLLEARKMKKNCASFLNKNYLVDALYWSLRSLTLNRYAFSHLSRHNPKQRYAVFTSSE